jgi:ATP/maltotriose-dependent transcriptional regulator MalT/DNA-binding SARP family transcriptional activator
MSVAVTKTKIQVPRRRKDLLSRPRLNSALADLLDYPFTLISAPAGYGKTCLLVDLAHQVSHPVCWYTIDSLDHEPKRFLAHLIQAIRTEFPEFGKHSLDLLNTLKAPLSSPDQFVTTLVNDIYQSITENFAIFMDDYHLVDDSEEINGFVNRFGQHMDENTHLVISSRNLFNFPELPLLIGRKLVKAVDQDDLAFQPSEYQAYFQEAYQQELELTESERMVESTGGWITGLLLSKDSKSSLLPGQNKAAQIAGADLSSYFSSQVLDIQPEVIKFLMLRTSLFDEFNETSCDEVLGAAEDIPYSDFLSVLTDQNLFLDQIVDEGIWIRYHHLFRDFLRGKLDEELPGEKSKILSRLVKFHLSAQNYEKAFEAANQLNDPEVMAEIITTAFRPLFHAGRIKLLSDWLEILPDEGYQTDPILQLFKGIVYTSLGNPSEGLTVLSQALLNEAVKTNHEYFIRGLLCKATTDRFLGNYDQALASLDEIIAKKTQFKESTMLIAESEREAALSKYHLGDCEEALLLLESSLISYSTENDKKNSALVHSDLGIVLMACGRLKEAHTHFLEAKRIWEGLENNNQLPLAINNLSALKLLEGNYEKSIDLLATAEEFSTINHNPRIMAYIHASKGDVALSLLDYELALSHYKKAMSIAEDVEEKILISYLSIKQATSERCQNRFRIAKATLAQAHQNIFNDASLSDQGLWHLELGFIYLAKNNLNSANEVFQRAKQIFEQSSWQYDQVKSIFGLIIIAFNQGKYDSLAEYLNQMREKIVELETIHTLLPEFSRHLSAIEQIAPKTPSQDFLQELIAETHRYLEKLPSIRQSVFPQPSIPGEALGLDIQALGEIRVSRNGKRLTASEWIHQKTVREIFFYLLAHPRGVTKDQVGLAFWPESSPSKLNCQFKNAMYRLRRAIGKEAIHFDQATHRYSFNWDSPHRYDVQRFQEAINQASSQRDEDQRLNTLQSAVTVYKHPYAPELEGTWAEPLRRQLYLAYEKAQLEIATIAFKNQDYTPCLEACQAILDIEPCHEKAYQISMKAHSISGDLIDAVRAYEACTENLALCLNIKPSEETEKIYWEIVNSQ